MVMDFKKLLLEKIRNSSEGCPRQRLKFDEIKKTKKKTGKLERFFFNFFYPKRSQLCL